MAGCTSRWDGQCGAYHRQVSLQTNASSANLHHLDITKAPAPWVCGVTNPDPSHLPSLPTMLESNLLLRLALIIWFQASKRCTHSPKIELAAYIVGSCSSWIAWLTSQCRTISKRNCKNTSMWQPRNYRLVHTYPSQINSARRHRPPSPPKTYQDSM